MVLIAPIARCIDRGPTVVAQVTKSKSDLDLAITVFRFSVLIFQNFIFKCSMFDIRLDHFHFRCSGAQDPVVRYPTRSGAAYPPPRLAVNFLNLKI